MRDFESGAVSIGSLDDEAYVVALSGEWDLSNRSTLREAFFAVGTARDVVLDLRGATYFDSTALKELIAAYRRLTVVGRRLETLVGNGNIQRLLSLTCLDGLFTIEPERERYLVERLAYARASR
jgi:anti-anti-sigma factor